MKKGTEFLSKEVMQNRVAAMKALQRAAMRGNKVCLMTESIMLQAAKSGYYINGAIDWRSEDSDDDIRPY